jgi:hypothetical protein
MLDRIALLLFVLGVAVLSYLYTAWHRQGSAFFRPRSCAMPSLPGKQMAAAIANEFDTLPSGALAFESGSIPSSTARDPADAPPPGGRSS